MKQKLFTEKMYKIYKVCVKKILKNIFLIRKIVDDIILRSLIARNE